MHAQLKIGKEGFSLPLDLVTQSIAILAKRGVGKTYTAAVFCEELMEAGQVPVILDPTGAHWGLKSSATGKSAMYPVVVFGGEHADLPLEEGSGEIIARAVVEQRFPALIDLSLLRKGQMTRFLAAFLETLYRLNRQPVHLICDEADAYAPQRPFADEARTLGAMEDIVRRGRIRGIGCTLITQRPACLNKNVLTQCEMLVAMRLVHPKDIDAVMEWVNVQADPDTAETMVKSLPSLPIGTAWFWSPGWGNIFERVTVRARRTFDSGATPKPGEVRAMPEKLAQPDLTKLGADIVATAQRAKDNDPAELKREVARLRAELAKPPLIKVSPPERIEISVLTAADKSHLQVFLETADELSAEFKRFGELTANTIGIVREAHKRWEKRAHESTKGIRHEIERITSLPSLSPSAPARSPAAQEARHPRSAAGADRKLAKCERALLTVLAQYGPCSRNKVAAISGYSVTSGGFANALAGLRTADLIVGLGSDPLTITIDGMEALGNYERLPRGRDLINRYLQDLPKCEGQILNRLAEIYPKSEARSSLAEATGYSEGSGGFANALSHLRTMELITRGSEIKASDNLFQ